MSFLRLVQVNFPALNMSLKDLRVAFKVEKSLVGYPNLAEISIYNLSESSRNKIEQEGERLNIYAGYEDTGQGLIFQGDIINVIHLKDSTEWITQLFCADGRNVLNTSVINKTLTAGTTFEEIYNELTGELKGVAKGITKGLKNCLSGKRSILRDIQLTGGVFEWLEKISKECGFEYSINDGAIETVPFHQPVSDIPPIVINQKNGMIGSPERSDIGVMVKTTLNWSFKLGRTFKIESISEKLNVGNLFFRKVPPVRNQGIYRIDKIIHVGDNFSSVWETEVQGRVF